MYIEHLVLPLPENEQVYKGAFRLWSVSNNHALLLYWFIFVVYYNVMYVIIVYYSGLVNDGQLIRIYIIYMYIYMICIQIGDIDSSVKGTNWSFVMYWGTMLTSLVTFPVFNFK